MTFLPLRANNAHRDFVSAFCSSPRISLPSKMKSTCRKPFRGVMRTHCGSRNLDVGFNPELIPRPYVTESEECGWQSREQR